jgi:hypothetical protein
MVLLPQRHTAFVSKKERVRASRTKRRPEIGADCHVKTNSGQEFDLSKLHKAVGYDGGAGM